MPLGIACSPFSKRFQTSMSVTPKPVDAFSRHSSGSQSKAQLGGPCQKFMGIGIASIGVSGDGAMPGSLKNSMNISMMRVKSLRSSLIRRLCVHIPLLPVPRKKNGGQDSEALGRSFHGGFTTKLNAAVSDTFLPLRFILTAGACHDVPRASALIAGYSRLSLSLLPMLPTTRMPLELILLLKVGWLSSARGATALKIDLMIKTCINFATS